jgi:putative hemolysin
MGRFFSLVAAGALVAATHAAFAQAPTTLANPASVHCRDLGGSSRIERTPRGDQYGVCMFQDNRQCEEWALLRGQCPAGGLRITGDVTPAARYCAITGGSYTVTAASNTATEQGDCRLPDGRVCSAAAHFDGNCAAAAPIRARFSCAAGKHVDAAFFNATPSHVELALSDGRHLTLPQAMSASGARYASADQRIVFWNKGDTAFIDENGRQTYADCRTQR